MNIIITGGSRGIGKAIALRFAREGWNVGICSRSAGTLEQAADEIQKAAPGIALLAETVDMRLKEEVIRFAEKAGETFGTVDVLVNNAGIFIPGTVHEEAEGTLEDVMAVNLFGAYHLTRALLPGMKGRAKGHIINMCSTASLTAYPNGGSYSISKFALLGFSRNLREELKPHHIKVTAVCPGPTLTDSWAGFEGPPERMMKAEDIAEVVWTACNLAPQTVIEDILLRPLPGDIT